MTGNKTLDFIISLLFWAAVLWWAWSSWKDRRHAKQLNKQRAEAIARGEWGDSAPDVWIAKKFPWLAKAWAAGIAYSSSFVFREELGNWPVVRHAGPGVLLMKAPYIGPRRMQSFGGWKPPVLTGAALGVLNCLRFGLSAKPEDLAWVFAGAAIYGGLLSIPFWWLARKTRLVIRFDHGAVSWRGPDRKKHVVGPEEPRSLQVVVPHRWADEERRIHDNWRQTHPGRGSPKALFQTASELVMHTGRDGRNWRTVAEFCNDLSGEQAHRLQTAIDLVTERAAEERAAGAREAANTGPL
jgi:hypothetical protein